MYWLVKAIHYSKSQAEEMIKYFELWQLDDLADKGLNKMKRSR